MAFDPRAYGAQVQSANQAYRARTGNMAPAQPQQTLATTQVQPTSALAASLAGSGRMRPNMNGAVTQMPTSELLKSSSVADVVEAPRWRIT